ncbi:MAG TPA: hypothetical protein VHW09_07695 [Bryobacteraceae bacterium]|jgi:hypothetical protein|nr:hypothetical protein [Bryobacteraceae bacterium]
MIFFLLRRDDSLKMGLMLALAAPLALLAHEGRIAAGALVGAAVYAALLCAIRSRLDRRATVLEMALPLAGREILAVRMIGALSIVWIPTTVAVLLLLVTHRHEVRPLLQGASILTVAALLPLNLRLRQASITPWLSLGLWTSAAASGAALWFVVPPTVHLSLFASASVVLIVRACLAVPNTFEISPRGVDQHRPAARRFGRPAWWPIFRSVLPWLAAALFLWGALLLPNIVIALQYSVFAILFAALPRDHTRWLQALPISNRGLLWITMATTAIPILAGVACGTWVYRPAFVPQSHPRIGQYMRGVGFHDKAINRTNVPLEFWRRAPGGQVPTIKAPWEETAKPLSISILGFKLFNPYSASDANTERFFEWQVGNATQAMYGQRMSFEHAEFMPHDATPNYPQENRIDILAFALLAVVVLFGVYLRELWLSRSWSRVRFTLVVVAPLLICMVSDSILSVARYGVPSLTGALLRAVLMHLATVLPRNSLALGAIAAVPPLLMYMLVERQFSRAEFTGAIVRPHWARQ